jgi:putative SOS response-associated peptidase YedK
LLNYCPLDEENTTEGAGPAGSTLGQNTHGRSACNDYRLLTNAATLFEDFSRSRSAFPRGSPTLEAREDIKITGIARSIDGEPQVATWCNADGVGRGAASSVYNFRSDGREFTSGLCLIPADGFYEFNDPPDKKEEAQGQMVVHEKR